MIHTLNPNSVCKKMLQIEPAVGSLIAVGEVKGFKVM